LCLVAAGPAPFAFEAEQKGLELKVDLPPQQLYVAGDKDRLYQVITNLVSNAIKYTERGFVHLSAEASGDKAIISVRDSGIGMSREEHGKIFDQFYRVATRHAKSGRHGHRAVYR
jgi:two-component system sensor histidine kinase EvgS